MDFVKKNAFLLTCGFVALLSLGLMFWGVSRMDEVVAEMNNAAALSQKLQPLSKGPEGKSPINPEAIRVEEQRIENIQEESAEVLRHFKEKTKFTPLIEGVFPDPPDTPEGIKLRYDFQNKYREAIHQLIFQLTHTGEDEDPQSIGRPPGPAEIAEAEDYLKKKAMEEATLSGMGTEAANDSVSPGGAARPSGSLLGTRQKELPPLPEIEGIESTEAYWKALQQRAHLDPAILASVGKARAIRCYVSPDSFELGRNSVYAGTQQNPSMPDIWDAQLCYWIYKDIVDVLSGVNDQVAQTVDDPWVGNMPVKDLVSVRMRGPIFEKQGTAPESWDHDGYPLTRPEDSMTRQASQTLYDVLNVTVVLVADIRDVPVILHQLCDDRYTTILNIQYREVRPDAELVGKVYGPEPTARFVIDLQTYVYYQSVVPFQPQRVRELLGTEAQFQQIMKSQEGDSDG